MAESRIAAEEVWGAHASRRAISGVSPESLVFGGTPNTTREDAYAPQRPRCPQFLLLALALG